MFVKQKYKIGKNAKGTSLIEALILLFVFSVAVVSFYSVFSVGVRYITQSKNRAIAISLANEKMEMLRNLPYDDVAIVGGIPNGTINPDENVSVGNKNFHITTDIRYYDDPDDGVVGGSPADTIPTDYKLASVTVAWGNEGEAEKVSLSSKFVPPGVETSAGGGTLSLNAIDFSGSPVPGVSVSLVNTNVSPNVNYNTTTDSNGNLLLQGVPADSGQNYQITLSKSGYETVNTYPPVGAGFTPKDVNMSIVEGVLNSETLEINKLSTLKLKSVDPFGVIISGVTFDLVGGRRLDDGTASPPVYNYDGSETTDTDGEFKLEDKSPGEYTVTITGDTDTDYVFWKLSAGTDENNDKVNLPPGATLDSDIVLMDKNLDSLFVTVTDSADGSFVENAEVNLKNETLGYDVTLTTDKYGSVYFPETMDVPLQNGETYDLKVTADNYDNYLDTITVNAYINKDISLDAS